MSESDNNKLVPICKVSDKYDMHITYFLEFKDMLDDLSDLEVECLGERINRRECRLCWVWVSKQSDEYKDAYNNSMIRRKKKRLKSVAE